MKNKTKQHWENIYKNKTDLEVSWYQNQPKSSFKLIAESGIDKESAIIDIGGGNSRLADNLLQAGYKNITVLDISKKALGRSQDRLDKKAKQVKWVEADILDFSPSKKFALWHDRATFHFFTKNDQIKDYVKIASKAIRPEGFLVLATFSLSGPTSCSGLVDIRQYSEESITRVFNRNFKHLKSIHKTHTTPFNTTQDFMYTVFRRL